MDKPQRQSADHDFDLNFHTRTLAESVPSAMSALYQLHTALLNIKSSDTLVAQVAQGRRAITAEWEKWMTALERCSGIIEDYIILEKSIPTEPRAQCLAFAQELLDTTIRLCRDLGTLKAAYDRLLVDMAKYAGESKVRSLLVSTPRPIPIPPVQDSQSVIAQFVATSLASLYPDGAKSFDSSQESLRTTSIAFSGLSTFWQDHAAHLHDIIGILSAADDLDAKQHLRYDINLWRNYRASLFQAIEAISSACDASLVDPVRPLSWQQSPAESKSLVHSSRISAIIDPPTSETSHDTSQPALYQSGSEKVRVTEPSAEQNSAKSSPLPRVQQRWQAVHAVVQAMFPLPRNKRDNCPPREDHRVPVASEGDLNRYQAKPTFISSPEATTGYNKPLPPTPPERNFWDRRNTNDASTTSRPGKTTMLKLKLKLKHVFRKATL